MARTPGYFKGKTIAITGAGSGIGLATAVIFGDGRDLRPRGRAHRLR